MTHTRSLVVLDDRPVLVDGIVRVAQFTYPDLHVDTVVVDTVVGDTVVGDTDAAGAGRVVVLGGAQLDACPGSEQFRAIVSSGATVIALVDTRPSTDVYELREAGVSVFVCISEGMNELLRAIDRAFSGETHLSPDAEVLFSQPNRVVPRISPRERQIVLLYLSENDWSVDDVAGFLQISSQTVRSHLARLRSHFTAAGFRVHNRLELRQTLVDVGIIDVTTTAHPYALPAAQADPRAVSRFHYVGDSAFRTKVG
ncbi:sigma factor-like helix-turn-helix DNA-binding protein [Subtercola boreus]|uniref:RNA polymerase sigma factor 70 region 4 type 2 domain-containing protein n=1 Tax=Subtercola boreus TaxID=120213 RepID=A0A3E0WBL3_9MICO|nr:sigma factor-like helix-turn-helix DNA-binding protein [Subtercola boreus]RFA20323.1 hypothetical protein B7R24_09990 [Subtercola boreus]RFA20476.1 hypothetical protein B7R23_09925 [Subtercola boreus]RFA26726.1 hypothetical protein B7R25_10055 [Subtercola boreus]